MMQPEYNFTVFLCVGDSLPVEALASFMGEDDARDFMACRALHLRPSQHLLLHMHRYEADVLILRSPFQELVRK